MTSKTVLLNDKFIRTVLLVLFLFPRNILLALFAVITGNRVIQMPTFLCDEMQDYIKSLYAVQPTDRIFTVTKSYLHREMDRGAKETSVKRIRIHDLRHPYVKRKTKKFANPFGARSERFSQHPVLSLGAA